jgi:hypothetical protein
MEAYYDMPERVGCLLYLVCYLHRLVDFASRTNSGRRYNELVGKYKTYVPSSVCPRNKDRGKFQGTGSSKQN